MSNRFMTRVAVFVLLLRDNKVFFLRRANTTYMDGWYTLPSGHLEENEFIFDAAIREVKEETGVEVKKNDLKCVHVMFRRKEKNYIDFYFVTRKWEGEPSNFEPTKCDEALWFDRDALPKNTLSYVKEVVEHCDKNKIFSEILSNELC